MNKQKIVKTKMTLNGYDAQLAKMDIEELKTRLLITCSVLMVATENKDLTPPIAARFGLALFAELEQVSALADKVVKEMKILKVGADNG